MRLLAHVNYGYLNYIALLNPQYGAGASHVVRGPTYNEYSSLLAQVEGYVDRGLKTLNSNA